MANKITIDFKNGFNGISRNGTGNKLEVAEDKWLPYELLFTALASCMYSTFLDVIEKKKLEYEEVSITIDGEKREEIPAFLKKAEIVFTVTGAAQNDEKIKARFEKSLQLAEKYCSIYNTLTKVAQLQSVILFK
ncbi:OsmC family protein [Spirochaeta isovalerica]|uniref:Putative redox protein n=1 Tax=Spirochaeta isovalerica TaxID=150 RepID=A0A841RIV2_9SPIO|nr:OsmC family protein [Spirochaeta isovalerica]MBB6482448.1 putative redox protein [Spirochaeta isovalerica]